MATMLCNCTLIVHQECAKAPRCTSETTFRRVGKVRHVSIPKQVNTPFSFCTNVTYTYIKRCISVFCKRCFSTYLVKYVGADLPCKKRRFGTQEHVWGTAGRGMSRVLKDRQHKYFHSKHINLDTECQANGINHVVQGPCSCCDHV